MHCNLGAKSDVAATVGYGGAIYQWGRKDPLWPNNSYRYGDGKTGLFFSTFKGMQKDAVTFEDAIKIPHNLLKRMIGLVMMMLYGEIPTVEG